MVNLFAGSSSDFNFVVVVDPFDLVCLAVGATAAVIASSVDAEVISFVEEPRFVVDEVFPNFLFKDSSMRFCVVAGVLMLVESATGSSTPFVCVVSLLAMDSCLIFSVAAGVVILLRANSLTGFLISVDPAVLLVVDSSTDLSVAVFCFRSTLDVNILVLDSSMGFCVDVVIEPLVVDASKARVLEGIIVDLVVETTRVDLSTTLPTEVSTSWS